MADDKKKAERHFNWQALKEAVERMKPELGAASEATHKHGADDTPNDSDLDRAVTASPYTLNSGNETLPPPPCTIEEVEAGFKVVDGNNQTIAYVYGHADPRDAQVANSLELGALPATSPSCQPTGESAALTTISKP